MSLTLDKLKEEISDMVDFWEAELQDHLYEEYEKIKEEIVSELYDEITEQVDGQYSTAYNFSMFKETRNENLPSNVYFISDGEFIKIGKADNIEVRLKQLQTSNAKQLFVIGYLPCRNSTSALRKETEMHNHFSKNKAMGEWYRIEILEVINILKKRNGIILLESED